MTDHIMNVFVTVEARQLSGEPYLAVRVDNASEKPVSARVEAPVVTNVKAAQPGQAAYWLIKLNDTKPGISEVVLQQFIGGRLVKDRFTSPYEVE